MCHLLFIMNMINLKKNVAKFTCDYLIYTYIENIFIILFNLYRKHIFSTATKFEQISKLK